MLESGWAGRQQDLDFFVLRPGEHEMASVDECTFALCEAYVRVHHHAAEFGHEDFGSPAQ